MGKKYTHNDFVNDVSEKLLEYKLLSEYKNMKTKIKVEHLACGNSYEVTPDNFKRGRNCPNCSKESSRLAKTFTLDDFKSKVFELVNEEYTVLGTEYKNARTPISMIHNECSTVWEVVPYHFIKKNGTRCPKCVAKKIGKLKRKNTEDFFYEVSQKTNGEYEVVGDYVNAITKIEIHHKECNSSYLVQPNAFLNGNRCPKCSSKNKLSKGEKRIKDYLQKNRVKYIQQYTFKDCKNIFLLPFDFAIIDDFNNVSLIVEFDGRHHYEPIDLWGGEKEFERTKKCDSIKNEYCKSKNIKIVRIPYWDYEKIDSILDDLF